MEKIIGTKKSCIIAGDINIDLIKYEQDSNTTEFINTMITNNFMPVITMPTRITATSATLVDHIYFLNCNQKQVPVMYSGNIFSDITDHLPSFFIIKYNMNHTVKITNRPKVRLFSKANNTKFIQELGKIKWDEKLYTLTDANEAYEFFIDLIVELYNKCFPLVHLSRRGCKDKLWFTDSLKKSCREKNKLYRKWLKNRNDVNLKKYKDYQKIYKKLLQKCETDYYREQFISSANNSKKLWQNLNKLCTFSKKSAKSNTNISKLIYQDNELRKPEDICNCLNDYFCNVAGNIHSTIKQTNTTHMEYINKHIQSSIFLENITRNELLTMIENINMRKSPGPDNIGPKLVRDSKMFLIDPLLYIFNLSFDTGIVPTRLKLAKVIPIYKKGNKASPSNYRPISMLSIFDKIIERLMYNRLIKFLLKYKVINKYQFGFRKGHSTTLALIEVMDEIYENLDNNNHVMGIFLDLQKAFDTVSHSILLDKLYAYGVRGPAHKWIQNYLSNRSQYVTVNGSYSSNQYMEHGVPPGVNTGTSTFSSIHKRYR